VIRYAISKDRTTLIRPWRVHMIDSGNGTITLIAMRQTWATCCSWLQRRIAAAEQPEPAGKPEDCGR
jgi:hypothetical protein